MQKTMPQRQKPKYPVESVGHALALREVVRDYGRVQLSVAAQPPGISPSTAHRLMTMPTYRATSMQEHTRRYVPGPALGLPLAGAPWTAKLRWQS